MKNKKFETYDFYLQLKPNPAMPMGDCSKCVFRNMPAYCEKVVCSDDDYHRVYWTFRHGAEWDAFDIFNNAALRHIDIRATCLRKIAQAYGAHNK